MISVSSLNYLLEKGLAPLVLMLKANEDHVCIKAPWYMTLYIGNHGPYDVFNCVDYNRICAVCYPQSRDNGNINCEEHKFKTLNCSAPK